jgi:hypothetical protein
LIAKVRGTREFVVSIEEKEPRKGTQIEEKDCQELLRGNVEVSGQESKIQ